jgi:hypothetical protein
MGPERRGSCRPELNTSSTTSPGAAEHHAIADALGEPKRADSKCFGHVVEHQQEVEDD